MELGNQKVRHLRVCLLFLVAKISCVQLSIGATLSLLRQPHVATCDCQQIGDDHRNASGSGSNGWPGLGGGPGVRGKTITPGVDGVGDEIHIGFLAGYVHSKVRAERGVEGCRLDCIFINLLW